MYSKGNRDRSFWIFNTDTNNINTLQEYLNIINEHIHWI